MERNQKKKEDTPQPTKDTSLTTEYEKSRDLLHCWYFAYRNFCLLDQIPKARKQHQILLIRDNQRKIIEERVRMNIYNSKTPTPDPCQIRSTNATKPKPCLYINRFAY